ncbi:MAG: hypothetical protein R3288_11775 [Woeseiaceae bacterium]|nr:hypothetical protein [Woeseiaceae bacterium]
MARENEGTSWAGWLRFFESRSDRPLPKLDLGQCRSDLPRSLGRSLAVFQLGESGGGSVIRQAAQSRLSVIDDDYAKAVALFVAEEHRHANLLAMCVRLSGGELIRRQWTARLFVWARRLLGLRLKVLVLLAAEIVGACFYSSIASALSPGPVRRWLHELASDERAHLEFHCDFLRTQMQGAWHRRAFTLVWRCVMVAAAATVIFDHRRTIRDLELGFATVWARWMALAAMAEELVTDKAAAPVRAVNAV